MLGIAGIVLAVIVAARNWQRWWPPERKRLDRLHGRCAADYPPTDIEEQERWETEP